MEDAYQCKGRFCTTCSVGESEEWGRLLSHDMIQVPHGQEPSVHGVLVYGEHAKMEFI
ncbi:hypothetical protein [Paenisporosarcina antarctica]|uniref:hypothetical protein n=1 Tax=Paenisporosarcina antarctica TaxID=417367 RepID=UPI001417024C|nr:hypothetical protein [Paenisporosarcina antarctica]